MEGSTVTAPYLNDASHRGCGNPHPQGPIQGASRKFKGKNVVLATLMCAALAATGASAYLTATTSTSNPIQLNTDMNISLTEPHFVTASGTGLLPAQAVAKDPQITNTGTVPLYAMATVKVPVFDGEFIDRKGVLREGEDEDLFLFALNDGWTKVGEAQLEDDFRVYTFTYDTVLEEGNATNSIFDEVVVANLTRDVGISTTQIDITAYAIQSHGFDSSEDAWAAYKDQKAKAVVSA